MNQFHVCFSEFKIILNLYLFVCYNEGIDFILSACANKNRSAVMHEYHVLHL